MADNALTGVHIFSVGTWNYQKFTAEDLADIAKNTNALIAAGRHKPPLKLGHGDNEGMGLEEGQPALGWIENLRAVGDNLYADFKRIPDTVFDAIKNELYRQVSVEMRYLEEFGWILTGVAMLGADLPAVKNLEDLQAYLTAHPPIGQPDAGAAPAVQTLAFSMADPIITGGPSMADNKQQDAQEARARELDERERKIAFSAVLNERKAMLAGQVHEGKLTPAIRERIVAAWEKRESTFRIGDGLDIPSDILPEIIKLSASIPTGEQAKDGGLSQEGKSPVAPAEEPDMELARRARLIMSQRRGVNYQEASDEVLLSDPALKIRYLNILRTHVGDAEVKHGQ